MLNTFLLPSANNFCKQFDPDQDRQIVSPDLDPNHLALTDEFFEKVYSKKSRQTKA